jgi:hypothetical protein
MSVRRDAIDDIIRDLQSGDASRMKRGIEMIAALAVVDGVGGVEKRRDGPAARSVNVLSKRLMRLCGDDDWRTRCAAIRGLGELSYLEFDGGDRDGIIPVLLGGISDEDGRVRWAAVRTLERFIALLPDELYVGTYMRLREMHERQNGGVRRSIGQALDRMDGPRLRRVMDAREYERRGLYTDGLEESLALEALIDGLAGLIEDMEERHLRRRLKMRSAPISPDAALDLVFARYNKNALVGMGKLLKLPSPVTGLKKGELVEKISSHLRSANFLKQVVDGLEHEERLAMLDLMFKGGLMPLEEFVEKHGDDLDESPYWSWHPPETVMGRLKARGLIAEGSHGGSECILIPCELRPLLQAIQKETKTQE